jgi:hypothetical protein
MGTLIPPEEFTKRRAGKNRLLPRPAPVFEPAARAPIEEPDKSHAGLYTDAARYFERFPDYVYYHNTALPWQLKGLEAEPLYHLLRAVHANNIGLTKHLCRLKLVTNVNEVSKFRFPDSGKASFVAPVHLVRSVAMAQILAGYGADFTKSSELGVRPPIHFIQRCERKDPDLVQHLVDHHGVKLPPSLSMAPSFSVK